MGVIIHLKEGTGKTHCRLCGKSIKVGQISIAFCGWNVSGQVHSKPEECDITGR